MKRLVLDAGGPLIALVSEKDHYHRVAKQGFKEIPLFFGEVLTPLPILFEVYKFVYRNDSPQIAQKLLRIILNVSIRLPLYFSTKKYPQKLTGDVSEPTKNVR